MTDAWLGQTCHMCHPPVTFSDQDSYDDHALKEHSAGVRITVSAATVNHDSG